MKKPGSGNSSSGRQQAPASVATYSSLAAPSSREGKRRRVPSARPSPGQTPTTTSLSTSSKSHAADMTLEKQRQNSQSSLVSSTQLATSTSASGLGSQQQQQQALASIPFFRDEIPSKPFMMKSGDHYGIPRRVDVVRVAVGWENANQGTACDLDVTMMMLNAQCKKVDHVSGGKRFAGKGRALVHSGDDKALNASRLGKPDMGFSDQKEEMITVTLSKLGGDEFTGEIHFLTLIVAVYSPNMTFEDILGQRVRISVFADGFLYASKKRERSSKELVRYMHAPLPATTNTSIALFLQRTETAWHIVACGNTSNLSTKNLHRQVSSECEAISKRLQAGWLPEEAFRIGGVAKLNKKLKLFALAARVSRRSRTPSPAKGLLDSDSETSETALSSPITNALVPQSSVTKDGFDTEEEDEVDPLEEAERNMYAFPRPPNAPKPPRVIREGKKAYSVGRSAVSRKKAEEDSEDEEVFNSLLPKFTSRFVVRYEGGCYNVGSKTENLLTHYVARKGEYLGGENVGNGADGGGDGSGEKKRQPTPELDETGNTKPPPPKNELTASAEAAAAAAKEGAKDDTSLDGAAPEGDPLSSLSRKTSGAQGTLPAIGDGKGRRSPGDPNIELPLPGGRRRSSDMHTPAPGDRRNPGALVASDGTPQRTPGKPGEAVTPMAGRSLGASLGATTGKKKARSSRFSVAADLDVWMQQLLSITDRGSAGNMNASSHSARGRPANLDGSMSASKRARTTGAQKRKPASGFLSGMKALPKI